MKLSYLGIAFQREGLNLIRLWPWHDDGIDGCFFAPDFMTSFKTLLEATKFWRQYQRDVATQTGIFTPPSQGRDAVPSQTHSSLCNKDSFIFKGNKSLLTCRANEVSEDTTTRPK